MKYYVVNLRFLFSFNQTTCTTSRRKRRSVEEVDSETKIVIKRIYVFGEGEGIITGRLSGFTSWFQNEWIVGMTRASIDEKIAVECGLLFL